MWWWTLRIAVPGLQTRLHLTDATVETIIARLSLKGQMEIASTSPKMDWRCPKITVGNKLLLSE